MVCTGRTHCGGDARNEEQVVDLVKKVECDVGLIEVAVRNIGANIRLPIRETAFGNTTKCGKWPR